MADTQTGPSLDEFADTLIKEKNYTTLSPELHDQMKKDLLSRLHEFLIAKTIAKLSEGGVKGLKELLDKNASDEEVQTYVTSKIDDAPTFIGDVLFQFRQTFLGLE